MLLHIFLQPGAKHEKVSGIHGNELKIAVNAPPQNNRANQQLVALLAKQFDVKLTQVKIQTGHQSRHKVILIYNPKKLSILHENCTSQSQPRKN